MYLINYRSFETITNDEVDLIVDKILPSVKIDRLTVESKEKDYIEMYINGIYYFISRVNFENELTGSINSNEKLEFLNLMIKLEFLKVVCK